MGPCWGRLTVRGYRYMPVWGTGLILESVVDSCQDIVDLVGQL